jgi:hypothetical protein
MNSTDNEEIAEQSKDDLADDTETDASATKSMTGCCSWTQFDGVAMAKGYNIVSHRVYIVVEYVNIMVGCLC